MALTQLRVRIKFLRMMLKKEVKLSFCSGCLIKMWKIRRWVGTEERSKLVYQCPICDTISYR